MHRSAMLRMKWFVDNYIPKSAPVKVLDVGSYNVNGCYRDLFKGTKAEYVGLDVTSGPNVDIVVGYDNSYKWFTIPDESFDFVISGNAFEHIEYPWKTMEEIYRVLKPGGIICILAPFAHIEHRYPVDCYRYLPDGFSALAKWAGLKVIESTLGSIPEGTEDPEWFSKVENYDDTVMIACKGISPEGRKYLPRFNDSKCVHKWS